MQRLFFAVQGPGAITVDHVLEFLVRMLVRRLQLFAREKSQGGREQAAGAEGRRGILGVDVDLTPLALRRARLGRRIDVRVERRLAGFWAQSAPAKNEPDINAMTTGIRMVIS